MDLEFATTEDIVNELLKRRLRFAFIAVEDTNSSRPEYACFSGKATSCEEVASLFEIGRNAFERDDYGY